MLQLRKIKKLSDGFKLSCMLTLLIVEDNPKLRAALKTGLEATSALRVTHDCGSGEEALAYCLETAKTWQVSENLPGLPHVILMDVQLAGRMNGIEAAVAIRREFPRLPVVFYSIQDDDAYYRDFRRSGILSHYAYVRKSNYLLPQMIVPLLRDAVAGRSFIDPDIESRVQEVRHKDEQSPLALLEPNEQAVAKMLAQGLSNEQIAARLGFKDKRTISRTNGQIYAAWGLDETATDEKVARTRAALIVQTGRLITWDAEGIGRVMNERGEWVTWEGN
jgi:DNA-binding NarL/FixJ family response regulator